MRIVIDGRMMYATGIGRYTRQLIKHFESMNLDYEFVVLMRPEDQALWQPTKANFKRVWAPYNPYTLAEQLRLTWLLWQLKADLVHFPSFNTPLLYLLLSKRPSVVTIHDLTLVDHQTSRYKGLKRFLQGYKQLPFLVTIRTSITKSSAVIVDTNFVCQQILNRYHLSPTRINTIRLGVEPALATTPSNRPKLTGPFLLYVGNYYPYKNIGTLIRALAHLPNHYQLVLVGRDDFFTQSLRQGVTKLGLAERVKFMGFVTDQELIDLYQQATLYVFPSLSEGFGLPGLEAMAYGTPVIAARASCLPEVYDDAASYFDNPTNPKDMARDLEQLLTDQTKLKQLSRAGLERVKLFSWDETAQKTLAVYHRLLK